MPVKWEATLDVKLLCTVIQFLGSQVSGENWNQVAEAMGSEFSAKACRWVYQASSSESCLLTRLRLHSLHYAKILKDSGADGVEVPASGESAPPTTPRKRKVKGESASGATPSKKSSIPSAMQEDDGDVFSASDSFPSTD